MEKNYVSMAREVEKLRAELANAANLERSGGAYAATGYKENDASEQHPVVPSAYEDSYGVQQGRGPPSGSAAPYSGVPSGPTPARAGYDAPRGSGYDAQRGPSYDGARGAGYDAARGASYDAARGAGYDAARGPSYDAARGAGYEALPRGAGGPQTHVASGNAAPYGSSQTPTRAGGRYEAPHRGGNTARRGA